jgi:hypothetical protein
LPARWKKETYQQDPVNLLNEDCHAGQSEYLKYEEHISFHFQNQQWSHASPTIDVSIKRVSAEHVLAEPCFRKSIQQNSSCFRKNCFSKTVAKPT